MILGSLIYSFASELVFEKSNSKQNTYQILKIINIAFQEKYGLHNQLYASI